MKFALQGKVNRRAGVRNIPGLHERTEISIAHRTRLEEKMKSEVTLQVSNQLAVQIFGA